MVKQYLGSIIPCLAFIFYISINHAFSQPNKGQTTKVTTSVDRYPFQDPALPFEKRAENLVSLLTIQEKIAQMTNKSPAIKRLGIPAYNWWNETLHGVARTSYNVTSYPQAIGMAATWDVGSLQIMGDYSANEGRAIYNDSQKKGKTGIYLGLTYWTPNINIFRDPRWGRGQETYGEDPYLTGKLGNAFVTGLQGTDTGYLKASACAKHFAVHSGPEPSRHVFNAVADNYDLWDTYLPAFRDLIVDAKVSGVMCAYNRFDGQPCCGSDKLMIDILRNQWHFAGYVTSDCGGIKDFWKNHKTHSDKASAAADAVLHGTDNECDASYTYKALHKALANGLITEKDLDISLKRLFTVRLRLGMFDPEEMVPFNKIDISVLECKAHKAHALKMAQQSIVLLKNQNDLLPLSKTIKKIAVVGPNAADEKVMLANYFGKPSEITSVLEGIRQKLGSEVEVQYEKGVSLLEKNIDITQLKAIAERVKDADVIIFAGGISASLEGEEMRVDNEGFIGGDRTNIALPAAQTELMKALNATGKPVVFVNISGSAIGFEWEAANIPAIIQAWYGGQAGGEAIADVLFGDYNPAGRLPVTFYKNVSDLPDFEDYSMENRTYRYFKGEPLFPFGHGMSYTTFRYSNIEVSDTRKTDSSINVKVDITNTGKMAGDEVVQLYVSHKNTGLKTPICALKGFSRIRLNIGETKSVSFVLSPSDLSLIDVNGQQIFPAGELEISVGGGQPSQSALAAESVIRKRLQAVRTD